jgi:hypothetical protein
MTAKSAVAVIRVFINFMMVVSLRFCAFGFAPKAWPAGKRFLNPRAMRMSVPSTALVGNKRAAPKPKPRPLPATGIADFDQMVNVAPLAAGRRLRLTGCSAHVQKKRP